MSLLTTSPLSAMSQPDLNLLLALDVLLTEGSVAGAARRLQLSPSAMSRTLARLREATGDPLLVRAGRALVATPRAAELRPLVGPLLQQAQAMLRPARELDPSTLIRSFTIRTSDGFVDNFGPALLAIVRKEAPQVTLHFIQKADKDSSGLRDGTIDLETGVVDDSASPELRVQALFRDRFVGVMRTGHRLARGKMTARRYAEAEHVQVSRRGSTGGPVDSGLEAKGLARRIVTVVGGFSAALALARSGDLVATVPERHTQALRKGMVSFALPFPVPAMTVSLIWHPRQQADQGHRWLRERVLAVCREGESWGSCD